MRSNRYDQVLELSEAACTSCGSVTHTNSQSVCSQVGIVQFGSSAAVGHVTSIDSNSDCYATSLAYATRENKGEMNRIIASSSARESGRARYREAVRVAFELLGNASAPELHTDRGVTSL